mgnify:CR=1 FL=1|tara:strand:+ start:185 stop:1501 length:1317 start_codon:yes stop_codon:yes gene_type:complete
MAKQFQKDLTSAELKTAMNEGRRLSSLTPKTKAWIQGRLLEDTSIKPKNKIEKAADSMTKTSGSLVNWVKKNPLETALLFTGAVGLTRGAVKFIGKKYGKKAIKKLQEGGFKEDIKDILKKGKDKESVISKKTPPVQRSGVDKIIKKKTPTPPVQRSGVDKLKIAKQKVNNSKQIKNLNLSFDDKQKVIQEMAKGDNKNLAAAFTKVLRGNGKKKSVISKPTNTKSKVVKKETKSKTVKTEKPKVVDTKKPKELSVQETLTRVPSLKKSTTKQTTKPKKTTTTKPKVSKDTKILLTRRLIKDFKNNSQSITKQINSSNMDSLKKKELINTLQDTVNFLKKNPTSTINVALKQGAGINNPLKILKKGGLIKKNIGGTVLKDIPAGNKGLPNLPTSVRNNMGYKKKGGTIKRSKGGLLGVGKALRGFGAVARKKGGKIAY